MLLTSPGTTVERVTVDTTLNSLSPAVHLASAGLGFVGRVRGAAGEGIRIANKNITLSQCEITKSGDVSVVIIAGFNTDPAITIHGCNITENSGVGVLYGANPGAPLSATGNWWGDPAGPAGPQGDGVTGNVDASAPLNSPAALPY